MIKVVNNQQPFQVIQDSFAFTVPYAATVKVYMSADGINYYPYKEDITTPDTVIVGGCVSDMYFYIDGITESVNVML